MIAILARADVDVSGVIILNALSYCCTKADFRRRGSLYAQLCAAASPHSAERQGSAALQKSTLAIWKC
jgi:hypothetical protein